MAGPRCWSSESSGEWVPRTTGPFATYTDYDPAPDFESVQAFRRVISNNCTHHPKPQCYTSAERYSWRPLGRPGLRIDRVDRDNFCQVMRSIGAKNLLFLGDSIMVLQAKSLRSLLRLPPLTVRYESTKNCPGTVASAYGIGCLQCYGGTWHVQLALIRSDLLSTDVESPRKCIASENKTTAVGESCIDYLVSRVAEADVAVLNWGAHYNPRVTNETTGSQLYGSGDEVYVGYVNHMLALARALTAKRVLNSTRVVYRSTTRGHTACQTLGHNCVLHGIRPRCESIMPPSSWSVWMHSRWTALNTKEFGWHLFPAYDRTARDLLEPLGVRYLDVGELSDSRPDGHTMTQHGGGRLPPDCLHYALPGVPDVWNALLIGALGCEAPSHTTDRGSASSNITIRSEVGA